MEVFSKVMAHKETAGATIMAGLGLLAGIFPEKANKFMQYAGLASARIDDLCDLHEDLVEKYGTGNIDKIISELPPKTKKLVESIKNIADTAKNDKMEMQEKFYEITDIIKDNAAGLTEKDLKGLPSHMQKVILSMDEKVALLQKGAESAEHLKEALDIAREKDITIAEKLNAVLSKIDESNDHITYEDLEGLPKEVGNVISKMDEKVTYFKTLAESLQSLQGLSDVIDISGKDDVDSLETA